MKQQNQQPQPPEFNHPQAPQPVPQYQPRVTASPVMDPVTAVKTCFKKYFDFKGRARRSEFWWFFLFATIVGWIFSALQLFVPALSYVGLVVSLALMIPQFAVMTRRLHDTSRSGIWVAAIILGCIVYVGSFIALIYPQLSGIMDDVDYNISALVADAIQSHSAIGVLWITSAMTTLFLSFVVFIYTLIDSKPGTNKYGPSPKYL